MTKSIRVPATGPIEYYMFKGMKMTASEIARSAGLSMPTVMRRLRAGLPDDQIVAAPHTLPRGIAPQYESARKVTPSIARFHLSRAVKQHDKCATRYANAIKAGEPDHVQFRLKHAVDKASIGVTYWRERVRMADSVYDPDVSRMKKLHTLKTRPDEIVSSETDEGE
jgi:DNA-binding transcriptional ArsR family regulator